MDSTLVSVKENPLLERREVEVEIDHEGEATPSNEDVKNRVAAENDLDVEKVEIESVYTGFGSNTSKATLKVYDDFDYDEELERDPSEDQGEEVEVSADYEEAVAGTITDAKDAFNSMDSVDWDAAVQAEKDNKNRTTLVDWLESQK
ncbi:MAG: hypothetical protein H8Z69_00180 [Nanohaloarchaea archaeon]|nr:hypothetical protein [Candidatus Nanohaloarchaea archaeon]